MRGSVNRLLDVDWPDSNCSNRWERLAKGLRDDTVNCRSVCYYLAHQGETATVISPHVVIGPQEIDQQTNEYQAQT